MRPPLVAHEYFCADPPELPRLAHGQPGPDAVARAELVSQDDCGVTLRAVTASGKVLCATVSSAGSGVIRVRLSEDPDAVSRSAKALPFVTPEPSPAEIVFSPQKVRLTTGHLAAEIALDRWHVRFIQNGHTVLASEPGVADVTGRVRTLPFGGSAGTAFHESFVLAPGERLSGTGERFLPLNLRGQRVVMWNFDAYGSESARAYKNVPFYQSSLGYGVLIDSGMPVELDFGATTQSAVQIVVPDDVLDYYVIAGPDPAGILRRVNGLTGSPVCPPKWAFGTWMSSGFFWDNQESVLERASQIRMRGIPCDVLHLDTYWQSEGKWSELSWNAEAFPDPAGMLNCLHELGFRVCAWINPYISVESGRFAEAASQGYLLTRDGEPYAVDVWHGAFPRCGIVDFTNPAATQWFQSLLRPLAEQGIDVFKTDFGEGVPADAKAHNEMNGTELHNVYSLLFNDAVSAVTRSVQGHGMVWGRSSYLGGQRHGAQWSGDPLSTETAMASTINGGLAYGLSGVPYWSHDVGGFNGEPDDSLFLRWAQFGALSPLIRFHGTSTRLPWEFPLVEQHVLQSLRLRYQLLPYIYSCALRSAQTGEPVLRAMPFDHPRDPMAWAAEHQYQLGPDLLVAPLISKTRDVYLPTGGWVDWWSGRVHIGPTVLRVTPPEHEIPLFARQGSLIPVQPPGDRLPDGPWRELLLLEFGGTCCDIRDDDGVSHVTVQDGRIRVDGTARVTGIKTGPAAL